MSYSLRSLSSLLFVMLTNVFTIVGECKEFYRIDANNKEISNDQLSWKGKEQLELNPKQHSSDQQSPQIKQSSSPIPSLTYKPLATTTSSLHTLHPSTHIFLQTLPQQCHIHHTTVEFNKLWEGYVKAHFGESGRDTNRDGNRKDGSDDQTYISSQKKKDPLAQDSNQSINPNSQLQRDHSTIFGDIKRDTNQLNPEQFLRYQNGKDRSQGINRLSRHPKLLTVHKSKFVLLYHPQQHRLYVYLNGNSYTDDNHYINKKYQSQKTASTQNISPLIAPHLKLSHYLSFSTACMQSLSIEMEMGYVVVGSCEGVYGSRVRDGLMKMDKWVAVESQISSNILNGSQIGQNKLNKSQISQNKTNGNPQTLPTINPNLHKSTTKPQFPYYGGQQIHSQDGYIFWGGSQEGLRIYNILWEGTNNGVNSNITENNNNDSNNNPPNKSSPLHQSIIPSIKLIHTIQQQPLSHFIYMSPYLYLLPKQGCSLIVYQNGGRNKWNKVGVVEWWDKWRDSFKSNSNNLNLKSSSNNSSQQTPTSKNQSTKCPLKPIRMSHNNPKQSKNTTNKPLLQNSHNKPIYIYIIAQDQNGREVIAEIRRVEGKKGRKIGNQSSQKTIGVQQANKVKQQNGNNINKQNNNNTLKIFPSLPKTLTPTIPPPLTFTPQINTQSPSHPFTYSFIRFYKDIIPSQYQFTQQSNSLWTIHGQKIFWMGVKNQIWEGEGNGDGFRYQWDDGKNRINEDGQLGGLQKGNNHGPNQQSLNPPSTPYLLILTSSHLVVYQTHRTLPPKEIGGVLNRGQGKQESSSTTKQQDSTIHNNGTLNSVSYQPMRIALSKASRVLTMGLVGKYVVIVQEINTDQLGIGGGNGVQDKEDLKDRQAEYGQQQLNSQDKVQTANTVQFANLPPPRTPNHSLLTISIHLFKINPIQLQCTTSNEQQLSLKIRGWKEVDQWWWGVREQGRGQSQIEQKSRTNNNTKNTPNDKQMDKKDLKAKIYKQQSYLQQKQYQQPTISLPKSSIQSLIYIPSIFTLTYHTNQSTPTIHLSIIFFIALLTLLTIGLLIIWRQRQINKQFGVVMVEKDVRNVRQVLERVGYGETGVDGQTGGDGFDVWGTNDGKVIAKTRNKKQLYNQNKKKKSKSHVLSTNIFCLRKNKQQDVLQEEIGDDLEEERDRELRGKQRQGINVNKDGDQYDGRNDTSHNEQSKFPKSKTSSHPQSQSQPQLPPPKSSDQYYATLPPHNSKQPSPYPSASLQGRLRPPRWRQPVQENGVMREFVWDQVERQE